ncbi:MAG: Ig-like domain-containing protein [Bacteroidales bacterium]|nr:Ig-like domain-containing protein [Bacteroidales bacterium]
MTLLLFSCATYGPAPVGGEKDISPPRFVGSIPANNSTNFIAKYARLNFDEYVQLKDAGKIFISPQLKGISYSVHLKQVRIDIMDTLDPEVTYTVNFGNSLTDINESNPISGFQYVFSYSNSIDTDYVTGIILDAFTLNPVPDMSILLFKEKKDSLYLVKDPNYIGTTDSNGRFIVNHIKSGCYYIYAIKEKSKNYAIEANEEKIAYSNVCISTVMNGVVVADTAAASGEITVQNDTVAATIATGSATDNTMPQGATAAAGGETTVTNDTVAATIVTIAGSAADSTMPQSVTAIAGGEITVTNDTVAATIVTGSTADSTVPQGAAASGEATVTDGTTTVTADSGTVPMVTTDTSKNELVMLMYQDKEPQYFLKEGAFSRRGIIGVKFNYPINDLSVYIADTVPVEIALADDRMSATIYTREMNLGESRAIIKSGEYSDTLDLLLTEYQLRAVDTTSFRYSVSTNKDKLLSDDSIILTFTLPLFDYLGDTQLNFIATGSEGDTVYGSVIWQKISPTAVKIKHNWKNEYSYKITVPYCTFSDFFDRSIDTSYITAKSISLEQLGEFGVSVSGLPEGKYFLQLLNNKNVPVKQVAFTGNEKTVDIKYIPSGDYTVWIYEDINNNGKWDEGDFYRYLQPEKRWKYNKTIKIEADWRIEEIWQVK